MRGRRKAQLATELAHGREFRFLSRHVGLIAIALLALAAAVALVLWL